jgi:hypothetical protein
MALQIDRVCEDRLHDMVHTEEYEADLQYRRLLQKNAFPQMQINSQNMEM